MFIHMHVWPLLSLSSTVEGGGGGGLGRKGTGGWVPGKKETRGVWQIIGKRWGGRKQVI